MSGLARMDVEFHQTTFFCAWFITGYSMEVNDLIGLAAIVLTVVNAVVILIRRRRNRKNNKNNSRG